MNFILGVRLTSSILMAAMLDDKHIQNGGMLCLSARNLLTWIIILQWVFCALCMVVEITACEMAPRGFLDFQKSLKIVIQKEDELLSTERRRQWFMNISREDLTEEKAEYTRVCSNHFISGNIIF